MAVMNDNVAELPPIAEATMGSMLSYDDHHWWFRGRRRVLRAELDALALSPDSQILDAGCGSGRTMQLLADYGHVSGVELSEQAAAVARQRGLGPVEIGQVETLPWPDASFDLITCLDVVEHTPDERVTLAELLRVCRPGGYLLVTVPAYEALWSRHDEISRHYRRYSRHTLRRAATAVGWEPVRLTSFNSLLLLPAAVVRLAQRGPEQPESDTTDLDIGPAWMNSVLEWPLRLEARWLRGGHSLPLGLSLLGVLRRPPAPGS
jgi:SAM-dependent methyltransferase